MNGVSLTEHSLCRNCRGETHSGSAGSSSSGLLAAIFVEVGLSR
jgi:hypothetical protein